MTNVVVVVADDARHGFYDYMPLTRSICDRVFDHCRGNVTSCNGWRSGFISGRWANDTGVYDHSAGDTANADALFTAGDVIFEWLGDAGVDVGYIGKDLIGQGATAHTGVSTQRTLSASEQASYGYTAFDGSSTSTPPDYQADYLQAQAEAFVAAATAPFFLLVTPTNPHIDSAGENIFPDVDDVHRWADRRWPIPSIDATIGTKPSWIQGLSSRTGAQILTGQRWARKQLRAMGGVDRLVDAVWTAVADNGHGGDTILLVTTDSGTHFGEQRLANLLGPSMKGTPYEPSQHGFLAATGPGMGPGVTSVPVCAQDLTATLLAVFDAAATVTQRGTDLRSIVADPDAYASRTTLLEWAASGVIPAGAGVHGRVDGTFYKLSRYPGQPAADTYELYDLDADPDELTNRAYDATYRAARDTLEAALDAHIDG